MSTLLIANAALALLTLGKGDLDTKKVVPIQRQEPSFLATYRTDLQWLDFYHDFNNGKKLAERLDKLDPKAWASRNMRQLMLSKYVDVVADTYSVDKAVSYLDRLIRSTPTPNAESEAQDQLTRSKLSRAKLSSPVADAKLLEMLTKSIGEEHQRQLLNVVVKKADCLCVGGQPRVGLATLSDYLQAMPAGQVRRIAESQLRRLSLIGQPMPALSYRPLLGEFPGFESLKGKVVVVHLGRDSRSNAWRDASVKVQAMYDGFKSRGLEMVTLVNRRYDNYDSWREYARRDAERLGITWPVAELTETEKAPFLSSNGLAMTIVLDRNGIVRIAQEERHDRNGLAKFKKKVEKILAEK